MKRFLGKEIGSLDRALELCKRGSGSAPRRSAAQQWFYRGRVPIRWFVAMLAGLEKERGGPVSVKRYVERETPHA